MNGRLFGREAGVVLQRYIQEKYDCGQNDLEWLERCEGRMFGTERLDRENEAISEACN